MTQIQKRGQRTIRKSNKEYIETNPQVVAEVAKLYFRNRDIFETRPTPSYFKDLARVIYGSQVDNYETQDLGMKINVEINALEEKENKSKK